MKVPRRRGEKPEDTKMRVGKLLSTKESGEGTDAKGQPKTPALGSRRQTRDQGLITWGGPKKGKGKKK